VTYIQTTMKNTHEILEIINLAICEAFKFITFRKPIIQWAKQSVFHYMTCLITMIVFSSSAKKFVQEHEFWGFLSPHPASCAVWTEPVQWREDTFNSSWRQNLCYASRLATHTSAGHFALRSLKGNSTLKQMFTWNKVLYRPGKCRCRSTKDF